MSVTITKSAGTPQEQTIAITTPAVDVVPPPSATLPTTSVIFTIGAVTAVLVYASLQVIKPAIKKGSDFAEKWWYTSFIRFLALVLGDLIGWPIFGPLGGPGSGWPIGAAIGAAAGAFDAAIYGLVRKRLKNATQRTNSE